MNLSSVLRSLQESDKIAEMKSSCWGKETMLSVHRSAFTPRMCFIRVFWHTLVDLNAGFQFEYLLEGS